jgi:hypothetical protein
VLDGRMHNLELYRRWRQLLDDDPDYAAAERALAERLTEQQEIYALRLGHALSGADALTTRTAMPDLQAQAADDAIGAIQALDRWHLGQVATIRGDFYASTRIGDRGPMVQQRGELRELCAASAGMVVTGGHVGVLLHLLHVFGLTVSIRPPLVTWSAGAMALSDRVVLFHTHGPLGRRHPEVYAEGLGAFSGVLPFPHPKRRLALGDAAQMSLLARRFAPRLCLLLPDGVRVDVSSADPLPVGARWIDEDGQVRTEGDDE